MNGKRACIPFSAALKKWFNRHPQGSASTEGDGILSIHALAAGSWLNEKPINRVGNALQRAPRYPAAAAKYRGGLVQFWKEAVSCKSV